MSFLGNSNSFSSDLFSIYLEQFNTSITRTKKLIEGLSSLRRDTEDVESNFSKICSDFEKNFKEAGRIINLMNLDVNLSGGKVNTGKKQTKNIQLLNTCRKEIEELNKLFKKEKENFELKKKEEKLVIKIVENNHSGRSYNENHSIDEISEENIILNISNQSTSKLNLAIKSTLEIENRSENIKRELHSQTQQLTGMQNKVQLLTGSIDQSNSNMRRISFQGNRNRLILSLFSFALVCMFILVLYSKN